MTTVDALSGNTNNVPVRDSSGDIIELSSRIQPLEFKPFYRIEHAVLPSGPFQACNDLDYVQVDREGRLGKWLDNHTKRLCDVSCQMLEMLSEHGLERLDNDSRAQRYKHLPALYSFHILSWYLEENWNKLPTPDQDGMHWELYGRDTNNVFGFPTSHLVEHYLEEESEVTQILDAFSFELVTGKIPVHSRYLSASGLQMAYDSTSAIAVERQSLLSPVPCWTAVMSR